MSKIASNSHSPMARRLTSSATLNVNAMYGSIPCALPLDPCPNGPNGSLTARTISSFDDISPLFSLYTFLQILFFCSILLISRRSTSLSILESTISCSHCKYQKICELKSMKFLLLHRYIGMPIIIHGMIAMGTIWQASFQHLVNHESLYFGRNALL